MAEQQGDDGGLSARRGGQVGAVAAVAMGGLLAFAARGNVALVACVTAATIAVAVLAHRLGQPVGVRISRGGFLSALGWGALSGLACLAGAACCAGVLGMIWAGYDGLSDRHLLYNYLRKPVLAVLGYGLMPALLLGTICGGVLWALTRAARKSAAA